MAKRMGTREPKQDVRWLDRRGEVWWVVRYVPRQLVQNVGKRKLTASLKTRDLREAQLRRHAYLEQFRQIIESAGKRHAANLPRATEPDWLASAHRWRKTLEQLEAGNAKAFDTNHPTEKPIQVAHGLIAEEADEIEWQHGERAAEAFTGIAYGTATPLLEYAESWLAEGGPKGKLSDKTAAQYRADLLRFAKWAERQGATTIQAVTKRLAGRYVSEELVAKGVHWATGNRILSAPGSYWKWLIKRGHAEVSPWHGQQLAKDRNEGKRRRAAKDAELTKLINGANDQDMRDLIMFAALMGGPRLREITNLRVRDVQDGWFDIGDSKTPAGVRKLPIHPDLQPIISRRAAGKKADATLFEFTADEASKRFNRFRKKHGVDDREEGRRQSNVVFHSLRNWADTKLLNARVPRHIVKAIVGHKDNDMTTGRYYEGPDAELLVEAIGKLRLP